MEYIYIDRNILMKLQLRMKFNMQIFIFAKRECLNENKIRTYTFDFPNL